MCEQRRRLPLRPSEQNGSQHSEEVVLGRVMSYQETGTSALAFTIIASIVRKMWMKYCPISLNCNLLWGRGKP